MLSEDVLTGYSEEKKMKSGVEQIPLNSFLCRQEAHYRYSCCQITRLGTACRKFLKCLMVIEQTWMHKQVCTILHIQKTKKHLELRGWILKPKKPLFFFFNQRRNSDWLILWKKSKLWGRSRAEFVQTASETDRSDKTVWWYPWWRSNFQRSKRAKHQRTRLSHLLVTSPGKEWAKHFYHHLRATVKK